MEWDLPDWIEETLEFKNTRDLQQHHVAEILVHGERPYYTLRRIRADLDGEFDRDTIRSRLSEMEELGIIEQESVNNGTIYWLDQGISDWPIPPDVKVEQSSDVMTVNEFISQSYVQILAIGIFAATVSGLIIWFGSLQSAGAVSSPFSTARILSSGLTTILVSYIAIILGLLVWILQKGVGTVDLSENEFFQ